MSEYDESNNSYSSTTISIPEKLSRNYINEKLLKKICILLEALIDLNPVKNLKKERINKTIFDLKRLPLVSLYDYLYRIIKYTRINDCTLINALIYIDRIHKNKFIITYYNIHKLIFIAIVLASKFVEDNCLNRKLYSRIGGITAKEFEILEIKFCLYINYRLYIGKELFDKYYSNINNDYIFNNIKEELKRI